MTEHPTPQDVERVAAGLTEAQRRYLKEAFYGRGGWRIVGLRNSMIRLGLCEPGTSLLTPFAMAVIRYIRSQDQQP